MRLTSKRTPDPGLLLLRSVCHELRPPVATLKSLVRALETHPSELRRGELARLATEHVAHAEVLLQQAAAAAYGLAQPVVADVPLHEVVATVAGTVPDRRLLVQVDAAAGRRLVHPHHTRQVLVNLLANADRHGPAGGPIRLGARRHRRGVRLTVADDGSLTADLARSLSRRSAPAGEKGLGLWVVRGLVKAHGGHIRARPLRPRGVALEVTLPRLAT